MRKIVEFRPSATVADLDEGISGMSILLRSLSLLVGITLAAPASGNCLSAKETKYGVLLTREAPFYSVLYKPDVRVSPNNG